MKMLFMVIEHFKEGKTKDIYYRLKERGRMMPEGLKYLDSWISADFNRCFQLIECDDPSLFQVPEAIAFIIQSIRDFNQGKRYFLKYKYLFPY